MVSLYHRAAQIVTEWSGEDDGNRADAYQVGREIVDMVVRDVRDRGFPTPIHTGAHDHPETD